eukprot:1195748-Prorocentrum_minimum.AAC.7
MQLQGWDMQGTENLMSTIALKLEPGMGCWHHPHTRTRVVTARICTAQGQRFFPKLLTPSSSHNHSKISLALLRGKPPPSSFWKQIHQSVSAGRFLREGLRLVA